MPGARRPENTRVHADVYSLSDEAKSPSDIADTDGSSAPADEAGGDARGLGTRALSRSLSRGMSLTATLFAKMRQPISREEQIPCLPAAF